MQVASSPLSSELSPEFRLAVATIIWPRDGEFSQRMQAAASAPVDWELFVRIAQRHRINGLALQAMDAASISMPAASHAALKTAAERQAQKSLIYAGETIRVTRLLQNAGISVACIKGAPLSMLAFGNLGLRHCRDIDLLVAADDVLKADEMLAHLGYQLEMPTAPHSLKQKQHWIGQRKHFEYKSSNGIPLELHWRLFDNRRLFSAEFTPSTWTEVPALGNNSIQTLALNDLLLYLCVHGANHMWFRLKWLADVHSLLKQNGAKAVEQLQADAVTYQCERAVNQALTLLQFLFGDTYSLSLADPASRKLVESALKAMTAGNGAVELETVAFGTSRVAMARYQLKRDWRFWAAEATALLTDERDRQNSRLPHALRFLLPVLRLPLWIGRRIRGRGQSGR